MTLFDHDPRQQAINKNVKSITARWVDVNERDDDNMKIRSRLVGRGLKAKTKEAFLPPEAVSATPPWEMITTRLGPLVTDGVPGPTTTRVDHESILSQSGVDGDDSGGKDDERMLAIYDISRAQFHAQGRTRAPT